MQPLWKESSMEIPQKIKNGSALWTRDSTSGNVSEKTPNTNSKEYMYPYVHCSIIYNCQDVKATQVPINKWVDETAVVHLALGGAGGVDLTFCNSMNWPGEYYAKWNKPVRERQVLYRTNVESNEQNKLTK